MDVPVDPRGFGGYCGSTETPKCKRQEAVLCAHYWVWLQTNRSRVEAYGATRWLTTSTPSYRRTVVGLKHAALVLPVVQPPSYRRTVVGLKLQPAFPVLLCQVRYRRTVVGLKRPDCRCPDQNPTGYRRTVVGLKHHDHLDGDGDKIVTDEP